MIYKIILEGEKLQTPPPLTHQKTYFFEDIQYFQKVGPQIDKENGFIIF